VRGHRRKLDDSYFESLPPELQLEAKRLTVLLRLSVLLNRNRDPENVPIPKLEVDDNELELTFEDQWLEDHPLVHADLAREQKLLKSVGFRVDGFEIE